MRRDWLATPRYTPDVRFCHVLACALLATRLGAAHPSRACDRAAVRCAEGSRSWSSAGETRVWLQPVRGDRWAAARAKIPAAARSACGKEAYGHVPRAGARLNRFPAWARRQISEGCRVAKFIVKPTAKGWEIYQDGSLLRTYPSRAGAMAALAKMRAELKAKGERSLIKLEASTSRVRAN